MTSAHSERWLTNILVDSWRSSLCRCVVTSKWNVEGGRQYVEMAGFFGFVLVGRWIDGLGLCPLEM